MRTRITLACSECKQRNYDTMKNKKNDPDRLEMNKYCKFCRKPIRKQSERSMRIGPLHGLCASYEAMYVLRTAQSLLIRNN